MIMGLVFFAPVLGSVSACFQGGFKRTWSLWGQCLPRLPFDMFEAARLFLDTFAAAGFCIDTFGLYFGIFPRKLQIDMVALGAASAQVPF